MACCLLLQWNRIDLHMSAVWLNQSVWSTMPSFAMPKVASRSGRDGDAMIFAILLSPEEI